MTDGFSMPASTDQPHQVVVLGMHRSGTSAVAGALNAMGLYAGSEPELMERTPDNPLGYFERKDVYLLTSAIFRDSGADWWSVSEFDPEDLPSEVLDRHGPKIRKLIGTLDAEGSWLLKDPRLCLLFPLFRPWLREPLVVIPARHPVEVAKSLRKRDKIPLHAGIALWELYVRKACQYARKERHLVVSHASLIRHPERVVARMGEWMEGEGLTALDVDSGIRWVDRSLHHQTLNEDEERILMNHDQRHLWRLLASSRLDEVGAEVSDCTLQVLKDFETDFSGRRKLERKLGDLTSQVESLEEQLQTAEREYSEVRAAGPAGGESLPAVPLNGERSLESRILEAALGDCLETIWKNGISPNSRSEPDLELADGRSAGTNPMGSGRDGSMSSDRSEWRPDLSGLDWHSPMLVSVVARQGDLGGSAISSCIECLKAQSWPLWELIIVGNPEEDAEHLRALRDGDARIAHEQSWEPDRWKAINQGLRRARGSVLTVWDVECVWHPDFLASSVMAFQRRPELAVVTASAEGSDVHSTTPLPNPVRRIPPIWGMVWRKALLTEVGELRPGSEAMVAADWLLRAAGGQPFELDHRLVTAGGEAMGHEVTEEWWMNRLGKLSKNENRTA